MQLDTQGKNFFIDVKLRLMMWTIRTALGIIYSHKVEGPGGVLQIVAKIFPCHFANQAGDFSFVPKSLLGAACTSSADAGVSNYPFKAFEYFLAPS